MIGRLFKIIYLIMTQRIKEDGGGIINKLNFDLIYLEYNQLINQSKQNQ